MMKNTKTIMLAAMIITISTVASANSQDPNLMRMPGMITEPGSEPRTTLDCIFMHSEILLEYASKPSHEKFEYGVGIVRNLVSEDAARTIESLKGNVTSDEPSMDLLFTVTLSNVADKCIQDLKR